MKIKIFFLFFLFNWLTHTQIIKQVDSPGLSFQIIKLSPERFAQYKQFRIQSLQEKDRPGIESEAELLAKKDEEFIEFLRKAHDEKPFVAYFAQSNNKLIGIAAAELGQLEHFKHRAFLFNVHVLPEYRAFGVGKELVQTMLDHLKSKKIVTVLAVTLSEHGRKLYESYGFNFMGIYPKSLYANGIYYDGYYMTKLLE